MFNKIFQFKYTFVLDVPFSKKNTAKHSGAKWNAEIKRWYLETDDASEVAINRHPLLKAFRVIEVQGSSLSDEAKAKLKALCDRLHTPAQKNL